MSEACIVGWAHSPFGKLEDPDYSPPEEIFQWTKTPEKAPERVAGAAASAPEGKAEQAPEQQIAGPAQVADLAGNAAAPSENIAL